MPVYTAGGLKLWEGSLDLVKALNSDIKEDKLRLEGKHVLEVSAFVGSQTSLYPAVLDVDMASLAFFAGLKGADLIHFQDFNAEVLRCLTMPNVKVNLFKD
ncbi:Putative methyltransferase family protein [Zea mays]|uniref:Putative methyltransferase family protein n=1 Tax=Zea mays TaxID=4577 RepID=A0A1D6I2R1_MAIZE|nr:Putative methyltransferase family protein [Zea mays]